MQYDDLDFWVCHRHHSAPTLITEIPSKIQADRRLEAYKHLTQKRGCVDAGANVGMWTRFLMREFDMVYAFEPNPTFFECFKKNIDLDQNVQLFQYGLSDKEHTASQDFNSTMMSHEPGLVTCRTLDSFDLKDIDLIKVDVDGFEDVLMQGAQQTIKDNSPVIIIEMKRAKRPDICGKVDTILKELGYSLKNTIKSDEIWAKT